MTLVCRAVETILGLAILAYFSRIFRFRHIYVVPWPLLSGDYREETDRTLGPTWLVDPCKLNQENYAWFNFGSIHLVLHRYCSPSAQSHSVLLTCLASALDISYPIGYASASAARLKSEPSRTPIVHNSVPCRIDITALVPM